MAEAGVLERGRRKKMNGIGKEGGKRPSAEPRQNRRAAFFWRLVSFFGETTEQNDCFRIFTR
ncbi:MAG: hypothetical protein ABSE62_01260 [Chthoniobacteraceae bacterium]|jgi:hypothetical protein